MRVAMLGLLILAIAIAIYYLKTHPSAEHASAQATALSGGGISTVFRCEGKTRCSEMRSCEEAKFYLQNCPDTKMDGDGDGVPCESQWCGE